MYDATVGERLVERISLTKTLLDDSERMRAEIARLRLTAEEREAIMSAVWDCEQAGCVTDAKILLGLVERFGHSPVTNPLSKEISAEVSSHPKSDRIYVSSQDSSD